MIVTDLYNGIYKVLANDSAVLNYLGVGVGADNLTKAKKITKRNKPPFLTDNIPLIAFYAPPGRRGGQNDMVYSTPVVFDIFTKDDVNKAHQLADRVVELFEGQIHPMMGITSFESLFVTAHETDAELANTYCFTVVLNFSVTIE